MKKKITFIFFQLSKFFVISLILMKSQLVKAELYDVAIYAGTLNEFPKTIQIDEKGNKEFWNLRPFISSGFEYSLTENSTINPELGFTYPDKGREKNFLKITYILRADYAYHILDDLYLRAGLGLFVTQYSGNGDEVTRNNGGTTGVFFNPGRTHFTMNFTYDFFIEYFFLRDYSIRAGGHGFNIFDKEKRTYSLSMAFSYHFGDLGIN